MPNDNGMLPTTTEQLSLINNMIVHDKERLRDI